jgi:hypothetical protein
MENQKKDEYYNFTKSSNKPCDMIAKICLTKRDKVKTNLIINEKFNNYLFETEMMRE